MDYIIDAKNKKLGRLASEIAIILQGKKSPKYNPRLVGEDRVILKNYKELDISEKKMKEKKYYHHTGYVGHLKVKTLEQKWQKDPKWVIREAVRKMLPKNKLNSRRLKNLIFQD
ncbi:MAG: 50S ribosomal protein L13 [Patescibacteria group bacterium]|nr:50S ribosomal protein L13 [Patescibacteria group bacterium]MCX7589501.1 50S ribosomal protein L13 [Patescibacteria group bacterium]MDW8279924.1 50S ribosomal protein L13 [bacterium]